MSLRLPTALLALATSAMILATGTLNAQTTQGAMTAQAAANRASAPKGELSTPDQDKGDSPRPAPAPAKTRAAKKAEAASAAKARNRPMNKTQQADQDKPAAKPW